MVSCGGSVVKILLAAFNFVWLAIGAFVIYLGIATMELDPDNKFEDLVNKDFADVRTAAIVVTVFGAAIVLVAFFGFAGACCESTIMLNIYATILLALLIANCAGVYFGHKFESEFFDEFEVGMKKGVQTFATDPKVAYPLQQIQSTLRCCGWTGPGDYPAIANIVTLRVPSSCCAMHDFTVDDPIKWCARTNVTYSAGCRDSPLLSFVKIGAAVSIFALIAIQLIIILAACCLAREIHAYARVPSH